MRYLAALLMMAPAVAQDPEAPANTGQTAAAAQAPAAANPAPAGEEWFTGGIDFGYRFRTNLGGSGPTYQSIVDLGAGPRLIGFDFVVQDPKKRLFDRLVARGSNWGDPYNTAHVDVSKRGIYDLRFDYSNILYYNGLPSFANPIAPGGVDEQWFDVHRRNTSLDLTLFPNRRIVPYLAFSRNSGSGTGISTFDQGATDTFPVASVFRDSAYNFRGGLRFELNRLHVTLEQGGTTFRDDDSAFGATSTPGDRTTTLMGQTLQLNGLLQAYGIRAHSVYSKALLTANPFSWLNVYGQFLFSEPKTDVSYQDAATGNFVLLSSLLFYSGQLDNAVGSANKPHVSGNAGLEARPFRRLRILASWTTDRFHDAAYSSLAAAFLTQTASSLNTTTVLPDTQTVNYSRTQTDLFFDVTKKLTLRGGYRYEWGAATVRSGDTSQIGALESGKLNRQVAIAGINFRPIQKLTTNVEYEGASTTHAYFTTSLYNYNRVRARARYQVGASLMVQANFALLDNQNPVPGTQLDFRSRDNSLAVNWTPNGGKRVALMAEYDRATLRSSIDYLLPPFLTPSVSSYSDNAHIATSMVDVNIPGFKGNAAKLTAGGSFTVTNGTRPSRFYTPLARLSVPAGKHVYWNTEWRYYGFNEQLYQYEGFRTHLFQTGLRLSR